MTKQAKRESISEMVAAANAINAEGKRKKPKNKPQQGKMLYRVDDNIPIPDIKRAGPEKRSPLHLLSVGQSVFIPHSAIKNPTTCAAEIARKHNKKFTSRTLIENGEKGVRIWRIK